MKVVAESTEGLHLESVVRLRPGEVVDVVIDPAAAAGAPVRSACVHSWSVASLGKNGPTYRGLFRWQ
jgi:hypothetical protein